jgi:HEAT repeat protein
MARVTDDELDELLKQTYSPGAYERACAVRALCPCHVKRNEPQVWERMLQLVTDPDPKVRSHVLHVLADGSPHERERQVVQAIQTIAQDADKGLRRRARKVLAQYRSSGRINVL